MDGWWLVVDRIAAAGGYLATTEDGRIARPWVDRAAFDAADRGGVIEGKDISFRRVRSITVTVRDPNGQPVPGAMTVARSQGNNDLLQPVAADEDGVAVLDGLHGRLADVYVGPPKSPYPRTLVGSVDLDEGSATLDATLPRAMLARIAMTCDGEARLPPAFRVSLRGGCSVVSEDPGQGEVLVEIPNPTGATIKFTVASRDYLAGTGTLDIISATEARGAVALRTGGWFQAEVVRDPSARVEIVLEKQDPTTGAFGGARDRGAHGRLHRPNGPGDSFRFGPLSAGVYRAVDRRSGLVSDPVTVVPGNALSIVQLVIAEPQWVTGTVVIPEGMNYRDVRVVFEDPRSTLDVGSGTRDAGTSKKKSVPVHDDGAFRIQVPGDHPVVVKPWHAWMQPTPDGVVTTTLGLSEVVLRLAEGREVRIRTPDLVGKTLRDLRVGHWRGAIAGAPERWITARLDGDQIRFVPPAPGACALMIDPGGELAPVTLPGVVLKDGLTELGPISFGPGTTISARILTAPGADPPRIFLGAARSEEPTYTRWLNSNGERVVKLSGLAAGRFTVKLGVLSVDVSSVEDRAVEVDGVSDIEWVYDLR